jgi:ABC-type antimicrobial peptide transport system permease subunit
MNEALAESTATSRQMAVFLSGFAFIAVAMAVLGLAGVLAYAVSQRTREIGLRMALGAQPSDVSAQVMRSAGKLVAAGLVIGVAVALATGRLAASMLYGVKPKDLAVFTAAPALLAAVALLTCLLPARRAASIEPATALRQE